MVNGSFAPSKSRHAPEKARATVAVVGIYAAYHLIEQLSNLGELARAYVAHYRYPKAPRAQVRNFRVLGTSKLVADRYFHLGQGSVGYWSDRLFDALVCRAVRKDSDGEGRIFHGLASFCRDTLPVAKSFGYTTIVDRACPHIDTQLALLRTEYERYGLPYAEELAAARTVMLEEYERADYIVVPSKYSYQSFIDRGFSPERIRVVPMGSSLASEPLERAQSEHLPFRVLFIGTGIRKGVIDVLEAWNRLRLPDAELIVRSEIPPSLERLAAQPTIRTVGYLSRPDLLALFGQATVFCYPSIDDGFGMVVSEAMGHGLPVIVTPNVGAADMIEAGVDGFVVPIRNPDAIAERIEFFYRHRNTAIEMGRNAVTKARAFSWERYGRAMQRFYDDITPS